MKAMLLRVGIDKGTDGTLAPLFKDGSFEYIPISESFPTVELTYRDVIGRSGRPLSDFLPKSIRGRQMHFDPEFKTCTYGDSTSKINFLVKLEKDDLLVFYAGLQTGLGTEKWEYTHKKGLYIIGYFTVKKVIKMVGRHEILEQRKNYPNNAHLKRTVFGSKLIIVSGYKNKSKLLDKGILINQIKYNKIGRPYQAVSALMEAKLGVTGSIQRSIPPRFIKGIKHINNLKKLLKYSA